MPKNEHLKVLIDLLGDLATRRQVEVGENTFIIYAKDLLVYELDDVKAALTQLGREPREPFEPRFPEIGIVLDRLDKLALARRRTHLSKFCEECIDTSGLIPLNEKDEPCQYGSREYKRMGPCPCRKNRLTKRCGVGW
jgi:hypothetical protein